MKGVILAAGVSSRLRPLTDHVPKCLLEIDGGTILGMTLDNLLAHGLRDIVIVTGYRGEQIRAHVRASHPGLAVEYVRNPVYETTNNIYSLWLTRDVVGGEEILLLDSDIVFDRGIIRLLVESPHESCLAMRRDHLLGAEEIKLNLAPGGRIRRIGKDVPSGDAAGESIGIERMGGGFLRSLYRVLDRMILGEKAVNVFYEAAFQNVIDEGGTLIALDVGGLPCIEIDTADDLEAARRMRLHPGETHRG